MLSLHATIFVALKAPLVSVPVLSMTTYSALVMFSRYVLPFIRIPFLLAPPIPPKKLSGIDITSAQGQLITRKVSPLYMNGLNAAQPNEELFKMKILTSGGNIARPSEPATTSGVYHLANLVINCSALPFLELAFSTNSSILVTVASPNSLVTLTSITPLRLIHPLITS